MKVNYSIIAGVYVLSTNGSACIVDSVSQISAGDNPLIAVSVNKSNFTNNKMLENDKFALSVLSKDVDGNIISTFGFNSSKDIDKFENISYKEVDGIKIINDSIGYIILEKINTVDSDTHTLFIGRLINQERNNEKEELVYQYYQRNKDEYIKVKVDEKKTIWVCTVCGYIYEGEDMPDDFECPICKVGKNMFEKKES